MNFFMEALFNHVNKRWKSKAASTVTYLFVAKSLCQARALNDVDRKIHRVHYLYISMMVYFKKHFYHEGRIILCSELLLMN
jgi:hypothetical protein